MNTEKFWLAVQVEADGGNIAYVMEIGSGENIFSALKRVPNAAFGNLYHTRKRAQEVANYWNECSRKNGNLAYS